MPILKRALSVLSLFSACLTLSSPPAGAQTPTKAPVVAPVQQQLVVDQQDAQRTRQELSRLLDRCPPSLREVLILDPTLLGNAAFLAPYPGLSGFLNAHPEIARNPDFFIGERPQHRDAADRTIDMWKDVLGGMAGLAGFGLAISLLVWLIRTFIDYRRWSRLAKVQTEVHTKLLDRFTANADLLAYMQTTAGAKFLESSPIQLDGAPRALAAPLSRILWSIQGGVVLVAAGIGLQIIGRNVEAGAGQPLQALGVLALAIGIGFVVSAIASFLISRRLGLLETAQPASRTGLPNA